MMQKLLEIEKRGAQLCRAGGLKGSKPFYQSASNAFSALNVMHPEPNSGISQQGGGARKTEFPTMSDNRL